MNAIHLTPIETMIAKPPTARTPIEQLIVNAYRMGDPNAERAAQTITKTIDYYVYIASPEWKEKADAAKAAAGHRCQVCNRGKDDGALLDAHHRTYQRLGHELPEDITVLCRECHELYEANKKAIR
jgi:5-methylcytosine-specific restriction endonuclease McrA